MIDMVFPALDPTIREKAISAHLTGKGRNQITRELNEQGFKVSTASVTNIIKGYERQHQETSPIVAITNTTVDLNKGGSPSSIGDELAERSEGLDIDFSDIPYPESYPNPAAIINQDVPQQNDTAEEKDSEQQHQSRSALSDSTNTDEEPLLMDWNPDLSHETIFWRRILAEKKLRQQELHIIKREREILEGERRKLAQKLVEYEALIESVNELKDYGISLEVLKQYLNMIENKAVNECISYKAAAIGLLSSGGVNWWILIK